MPLYMKHGYVLIEKVELTEDKEVRIQFKNQQGMHNIGYLELHEARKLLCALYAMEELQ